MQVYFNATGSANSLNTARINQGLANQGGQNGSQTMRQLERRDSIQIKGKMGNQLEGLLKQKMSLTEQKGKLVSATLEKGGTMDSIKTQVEAYEEKLKLIEEQINQVMMQELQKKVEKKEPKADESPKTEEELEQEKVTNLSAMASALDQAKVTSAIQTQVEGESRVLKIEIELDQSRGTVLNAKGSVEKKEARLVALEQKANALTSETLSKLSEVNEKLADTATTPVEKTPENSPSSNPPTEQAQTQAKESVQGTATESIPEKEEKQAEPTEN